MNQVSRLKSFLPLIIFTIIGALLRFWKLGEMPPSLNWDEISHGYNAYSILKTGKDEWGVFLPHIFRAFGDYKLPIYIYSTVLPVLLFGLTPLAVRFVSALAGTLAIPGIFLLTKELFKKNNQLPYVSAFLLTVTPWHFFISRPALEANLSLTLTIFGFYFLLRFFENGKGLIFSSILLSLSLHTYNTARVFVPLLLIVIIFVNRKQFKFTSRLFLPIFIFALSTAVILYQIRTGEGIARYEKLKILSETNVYQIGQHRLNSYLPGVIAKMVHNRPVFFATTFFKNYIGYFSPQFFFQSFGSQSQFSVPQTSLLTIPVLLLAILGLISSLRNLVTPGIQILFGWLLLSPVAAALTVDPPQALRPNPMIPALIIFASFALIKLPKIIYYLFVIIMVISFGSYLQNYFGEYKTNYSQSWQYGYKEAFDYVNSHKENYQNIFITKRLGEPHIFYSFYTELNPADLQPSSENIRFMKSGWYWTDKINNVYFVNDWDIPTTSVSKIELESGQYISANNSLLVTSPDHLPVNCSKLEAIQFLDGQTAFIICSIP